MAAGFMGPFSATENQEPFDTHYLCDLVEATGLESFAERVLDVLVHAFDAQHCTIFQMKDYELTQIGAASLVGAPMMPKSELTPYEVKRQLTQVPSTTTRIHVHTIARLPDSCN